MRVVYNLILALTLLNTSGVSYANKAVVLGVNNHVVLNGDINKKLVDDIIFKIASHPKNSLYLYVNSPGGSIHSGNVLVEFLKTTKKKVFCIADYAASMAFTIVQYCHKRLVSNNSILMQHEASLELHDSVPKLLSMLKMIVGKILITETGTAGRLGISYKKYKEKIANDWWIHGGDAVDEGVADEVRSISCTNKLIKQTTTVTPVEGLMGMHGLLGGAPAIPVKVSKCPLIAPITDNTGRHKTWSAEYIKKLNRYKRYEQ